MGSVTRSRPSDFYPALLSLCQSKGENECGMEGNGIMVIAGTLRVIGVLQGAISLNKE